MLKRFNRARCLPGAVAHLLEDFRKRAGLPDPSAAEVEAYERERAGMGNA